ncbi:branched-chain amino acid ABC transporter permease [Aerococcus urinaehominis]|uniref:Branched-chain amino acid ABC transporter permease n=1 Tax=Aerococcus urinaehominis TaxID=128944 RepID=A0A0X8FK17_9LACT|nr:ABC transporter permease [Aerococcus urinaehominis]AMB98682.1 branched-chain amino acid ABC transporter permease [Aerococcus urinaehominis]SDL98466.1 nucleoside ABC transporter membrane protein [Aerococcus urinaehominis]
MPRNLKMSQQLLVALLAVLLGLLVGALIMLAFGYNPLLAYQAMFMGVLSSPYFFGEALSQATILALTGLAFALASKAGFFNIGLSGQFLMGWLAAIVVSLTWPNLPAWLSVVFASLAGVLAGALWAGIAGFLRAYRGASEVITTIMLNYIGLHLTNWIIATLYQTNDASPSIDEGASLRLDFLSQAFSGSRLNGGLFIMILVLVLYIFVMSKTTLGYEIKSAGLNPLAAEYAGMNTRANIVLSMALSGGLAGLAGVINGLGIFHNIFIQRALPQEGFNGIAVALLGMNNPVGILLSSGLFSILQTGSRFMPNASGVPDELAQVVIAAIIFFVGANYLIQYMLNKLKPSKGGINNDNSRYYCSNYF